MGLSAVKKKKIKVLKNGRFVHSGGPRGCFCTKSFHFFF